MIALVLGGPLGAYVAIVVANAIAYFPAKPRPLEER